MPVNQTERAARAWPILVRTAKKRSKITYGDLAKAIGIHHRPIRYVLDKIQNYCLNEELPPLTILVVSKKGELGSGFIAFDVRNAEEGRKDVYEYIWESIENPFLPKPKQGESQRDRA